MTKMKKNGKTTRKKVEDCDDELMKLTRMKFCFFIFLFFLYFFFDEKGRVGGV